MHHLNWALAVAPLALVTSHAGANAADAQPSISRIEPAPAQASPQLVKQTALPTAQPQPADAVSVVSLKDLEDMRGGTQTAINSQTIISQITGNMIEGDFTAGDVSFSDNALSGFNGLGNIVVNTGALSSLQATLGVTINTAD